MYCQMYGNIFPISNSDTSTYLYNIIANIIMIFCDQNNLILPIISFIDYMREADLRKNFIKLADNTAAVLGDIHLLILTPDNRWPYVHP